MAGPCPTSPSGQHYPNLDVQVNEDGTVTVKTICGYCNQEC